MAQTLTFPDAIQRAVKAYYEGANFESYEKTSKKPTKYKQEMFDEVQSSYKRKAKRDKKKSEVETKETVDNG